jgi:hypothetical protein
MWDERFRSPAPARILGSSIAAYFLSVTQLAGIDRFHSGKRKAIVIHGFSGEREISNEKTCNR